MFNKLIASAPGPRRWLRNPAVIIVSVAAHILVLGGIVWASTAPEPEPEPEPEQVTYIDVTDIPPPPEPDVDEVYEAPPEDASPRPASAAPAPRTPPAAPRDPRPTTAATDEPAGFQELEVPDLDVSGIPPPDAAAEMVRPEDFGGRGTAGGTASGIPAPPQPAARSGGGGAGAGDANATFSANLVDEPVELINRSAVVRILGRRYPPDLRDAGVEGRVVVEFVVDRNGRVEAGTIKIVSASSQEFTAPSREAVAEFRFRAAKKQGQTVRQVVRLPVIWEVQNR